VLELCNEDLVWSHCVIVCICYIIHERAICRNPLIHNFMADRKEFDWSSLGEHLSMLCFYKSVRTSIFLWTQHLTEDVFSTQLSSNVVISVWWIEWVTTHCCFVGSIQLNLLAISSEIFACACHALCDNWTVMGKVRIIPMLVLELVVIKAWKLTT